MSNPTNPLDLNAKRALRREATGVGPTLLFGDSTVELPHELPLDVLHPLEVINLDLALIVRSALDMMKSADNAADGFDLVVDLLVANPNLPRELIDAMRESARLLFGETGYEAFVLWRPSPQDLAVLIMGLFEVYSVSLPEASSSSESSVTGGATSKPISPTTTPESMPEGSGVAPETPGSSGHAVSAA